MNISFMTRLYIHGLIYLWKSSTFLCRSLENLRPLSEKQEGNEIINDMTEAYNNNGIPALEELLDDFNWVADPFDGKLDYVSNLWYTAYNWKGDCDDSAWLINHITKYPIYAIWKFDNNKFKSGHLVNAEKVGVFSSFEFFNMSLKRFVERYFSEYDYLVKLTSSFSIKNIQKI